MQNEKISSIETATAMRKIMRCAESRREPQTGRRGRSEQVGERVAGTADFRDCLNAEIDKLTKEREGM